MRRKNATFLYYMALIRLFQLMQEHLGLTNPATNIVRHLGFGGEKLMGNYEAV